MATKKTPAKTASAKKTVANKKGKTVKAKSVAKPKVAAKAPAKKKKAVAKKAVAKKTPVKKTAAKKTPAKTPAPSVPKAAPLGNHIDNVTYALLKTIVDAIQEKKGENLLCLDLRDIENRVCDFFIICEGNSSTQIDAIAASVEFKVKKELGEYAYRSEGWDNALWILIDYVNVIVHVFDRETRAFYNLESLWADADEIKFKS